MVSYTVKGDCIVNEMAERVVHGAMTNVHQRLMSTWLIGLIQCCFRYAVGHIYAEYSSFIQLSPASGKGELIKSLLLLFFPLYPLV